MGGKKSGKAGIALCSGKPLCSRHSWQYWASWGGNVFNPIRMDTYRCRKCGLGKYKKAKEQIPA